MLSVGTILAGLLSFMSDSQQTTGSIVTGRAEKEAFAAAALAVNVKNPTFRRLFPEWVEAHQQRVAAAAAAVATAEVVGGTERDPGDASGGVGSAGLGRADGATAAGGGPPPLPPVNEGSGGAFLFSVVVAVLMLAVAVVPLITGRSNWPVLWPR